MLFNWIDLIKLIPFSLFMIYARIYGMTDLAWKDAFILGGIAAILVFIIQLHKKVIMDRLILGMNLFLLFGAICFLFKWYSFLYYYSTYKGVVFFSSIFLVGLCTACLSKAGFVGVLSKNKKDVIRYSWYLLGVNGILIGCMMLIGNNFLGLGELLPIIVGFSQLKITRDKFVEIIKS